MLEKKSLSFPLWAEAIFVIVLFIMAITEYLHDQWPWAAIFALAALFFGISVILRFHSGDKHGPA